MSDSPVKPHDDVSRLPSRVTVLSGGVGGARFLQGLLRLIERSGSATSVTVVANTGADDIAVPSSLADSAVLVASGPFDGRTIHGDTTVWFTTPSTLPVG